MAREHTTLVACATTCAVVALLARWLHERRQAAAGRATAGRHVQSRLLHGAVLYHIPKTSSAPIVQLLDELCVPLEAVRVETMSFAAVRAPPYAADVMLGATVPALRLASGATLVESAAIALAVCEAFDPVGALHPRAAAAADETAPEPDGDDARGLLRAKFGQFVALASTAYHLASRTFLETLKPPAARDDADRKSAG